MSERTYIDGDNAKISKVEENDIFLNVEMYDGRKFEGVEARRLFPVTGFTKYITLLDEEGVEQAIIRNVDTLMPESKAVVMDVLKEYYLIPKITRITDVYEKFGRLKFTVETDRGKYSFDIKNSHSDIKSLYDDRILFRDSSDNRYEIPDMKELDKGSMRLIHPYL